MGAMLMEWHERWITGPRDFTMEQYHEVLQARRAASSCCSLAPTKIYSTIGTGSRNPDRVPESVRLS